MKKLFLSLCVAAFASVPMFAQETAAAAPAAADSSSTASVKTMPAEKASWPVWIAFNSTKNIDVVGLRLTIPYGSCEDVTGFDLGLFGRCRYMNGLQANILRNDVTDVAAGIQVGIYNSVGRDDMLGAQVGLWNETHSFQGLQVGLINLCDGGNGFQVGIINRAEAFYGFQVGVINVIRGSEIPFMPLLNVGF